MCWRCFSARLWIRWLFVLREMLVSKMLECLVGRFTARVKIPYCSLFGTES